MGLESQPIRQPKEACLDKVISNNDRQWPLNAHSMPLCEVDITIHSHLQMTDLNGREIKELARGTNWQVLTLGFEQRFV